MKAKYWTLLFLGILCSCQTVFNKKATRLYAIPDEQVMAEPAALIKSGKPFLNLGGGQMVLRGDLSSYDPVLKSGEHRGYADYYRMQVKAGQKVHLKVTAMCECYRIPRFMVKPIVAIYDEAGALVAQSDKFKLIEADVPSDGYGVALEHHFPTEGTYWVIVTSHVSKKLKPLVKLPLEGASGPTFESYVAYPAPTGRYKIFAHFL